MAYENRQQAHDPAFGRHGQDTSNDGPKNLTSSDVLAANEKVKKGLQASIDAAPHPYSISAKHDEAELRAREKQHPKNKR
jgi:hypothetical protein